MKWFLGAGLFVPGRIIEEVNALVRHYPPDATSVTMGHPAEWRMPKAGASGRSGAAAPPENIQREHDPGWVVSEPERPGCGMSLIAPPPFGYLPRVFGRSSFDLLPDDSRR